MHDEMYVLKTVIGSCVDHWLRQEDLIEISLKVIDPEDPLEEHSNLVDTHVKMSVFRGKDGD